MNTNPSAYFQCYGQSKCRTTKGGKNFCWQEGM